MNEKNLQELINRINFKNWQLNEYFTGEWTSPHACRVAELDGLIDALEIVTGKQVVLVDGKVTLVDYQIMEE